MTYILQDIQRGESYLKLRPDRVAMQDATAQVKYRVLIEQLGDRSNDFGQGKTGTSLCILQSDQSLCCVLNGYLRA